MRGSSLSGWVNPPCCERGLTNVPKRGIIGRRTTWEGECLEHEQIERINELARKKKTVGLTADELEEQAQLRAQYLREFRANMEDTLRRVRGEQADGSYKPLVKKDKLN